MGSNGICGTNTGGGGESVGDDEKKSVMKPCAAERRAALFLDGGGGHRLKGDLDGDRLRVLDCTCASATGVRSGACA